MYSGKWLVRAGAEPSPTRCDSQFLSQRFLDPEVSYLASAVPVRSLILSTLPEAHSEPWEQAGVALQQLQGEAGMDFFVPGKCCTFLASPLVCSLPPQSRETSVYLGHWALVGSFRQSWL